MKLSPSSSHSARLLHRPAAILAAAGLLAPLAAAEVRGDFNGDGYADLAIGDPYGDVGAVGYAGAVTVLYGGPLGPGALGAQAWNQDTPGVPGVCESGDRFGACLATGDFDGDGYFDLAIGTPGEDIGSIADAGSVQVLYGGPGGLTTAGVDDWYQGVSGVPGADESSDGFGASLAAGDFDGDGYWELAIGAPDEDSGSLWNAGFVVVLAGTASGLSTAGVQSWYQDLPDVPGAATKENRMGQAIAAGDFDGDGTDDLAVGVPGAAHLATPGAGMVLVLYGSVTSGLGTTSKSIQQWKIGVDGVPGTAQAWDSLGWVLTAGDLNGDGFDDLVAGLPYRNVVKAEGTVYDAGGVLLIHGSPAGLATLATPAELLEQEHFFALSESSDEFGASVAAGDVDGDGDDDLLIGAPGEDGAAGSVLIGLGATIGLIPLPFQLVVPAPLDVSGTRYGYRLAAGDYDGNGLLDFALSAPGLLGAGAVQVRSLTLDQAFLEGVLGVPGDPSSGEFGSSL